MDWLGVAVEPIVSDLYFELSNAKTTQDLKRAMRKGTEEQTLAVLGSLLVLLLATRR